MANLEPRVEVARSFLDFAFGGISGHDGALIEIAHSGSDGGAINRASLFENTPEGRQEAAEYAARVNSAQGVNCYFAPSLRLPTANRRKRAKKADVLGSPMVWADFDEPGSPQRGRDVYTRLGFAPHKIVVTGRAPETRAQAFWMLNEIVTDQAQLDEMLAGVHVGLDFVADPKVVNADRVMRLPGSISWPKPGKEGREVELTELHTPGGAPAASHSVDEITAVFPRRDPIQARKGQDVAPGEDLLSRPATTPKASSPSQVNTAPKPAPASPQAPQAPEREFDMMGRRIEGRDEYAMKIIGGSIRNLAARLDRWPTPQEIFDDSWPTFEGHCAPKRPAVGESIREGLERESRGPTWFGEKCATHARRAQDGAIGGMETVEKAKQRALESAAQGGRSAPQAPAGQVMAGNTAGFALTNRPPLRMDPGCYAATRFIGRAVPDVEWLVEDILPAGRPAVLAAIGGLGKSYSTLDLCLKIAGGPIFSVPQKWFGHDVRAEGSVLFVTAEDDENAVHRRLDAITDDAALAKAAVRLNIVPLPDEGGALHLVAGSRNGPTITEHMVHLIEDAQKYDDLKLVVIDPLQAFVGGDINADPAVAQTLWSALSQITALTGAAVMVLHHMKKDGAHEMKSLAQAREGIRGTSAIVDGARLALAMYPLDTDRAQTASKSTQIPYEFGTYVAGGVVKSNDQNDKSEHFFIRAETGLLEDRTGEVALAITEGRKLSTEQVSSIFDAISKALENGEPFGTANNSKRPLSKWISENMDVTISVARSYVTAWKDAGHFETHREPGTGRQGIRVHSRPV